MKNQLHKVGAVFYALWGVLHVVAGASLVASALTNVNGHLGEIGTAAAPVAMLPEGTVVSGILAFHSFTMVWAGLVVLFVAVRLGWRGSSSGYWINLALTGFLDLGLIVFLLVPGYMAWSDGWMGPLLFAGGAVFSTLARLRQNARASAPADAALVGAGG